jgi:hypothetical protein
MTQNDLNRKIFNLNQMIERNHQGGAINMTGNTNRFTVKAKTIFSCKFEYYKSDVKHYNRKIYDVLFENYMNREYPVLFDTIGYFTRLERGSLYLYVDLGFRMSDLNDALKFAQYNLCLPHKPTLWDNLNQKEINVYKYLFRR